MLKLVGLFKYLDDEIMFSKEKVFACSLPGCCKRRIKSQQGELLSFIGVEESDFLRNHITRDFLTSS